MKKIIILLSLIYGILNSINANTGSGGNIGTVATLQENKWIEPYCSNNRQVFRLYEWKGTTLTQRWVDSSLNTITVTSATLGTCKQDTFCLSYEIVDSSYSSDSAFIKLTNQRIDSTNAKLDSLVYYTKLMAKRLYNTNEATYLGTSSTATFAANTYHSVSVVILSSTADIYVGGVLKYASAPIGFSTSFTATELLENSIQIITDTSGKAFITTLK